MKIILRTCYAVNSWHILVAEFAEALREGQ